MKAPTAYAHITFIRGRPGTGCTTRLMAYDAKDNELYEHWGTKARVTAAALKNRGIGR